MLSVAESASETVSGVTEACKQAQGIQPEELLHDSSRQLELDDHCLQIGKK